MSDRNDDAQHIRDVVLRLSAAWQQRRYEELADYFDDRAVIAAPGFTGRAEGRSACTDSYREFMERATIELYEQGEPVVDVWESTAVATYSWEMAWTLDGAPDRDAGHDVLVFQKRTEAGASAWKVVWRTITSAAATG